MRISDWSSDVCSSDLPPVERPCPLLQIGGRIGLEWQAVGHLIGIASTQQIGVEAAIIAGSFDPYVAGAQPIAQRGHDGRLVRSEERRVGKECVSTCRYRWSPIP